MSVVIALLALIGTSCAGSRDLAIVGSPQDVRAFVNPDMVGEEAVVVLSDRTVRGRILGFNSVEQAVVLVGKGTAFEAGDTVSVGYADVVNMSVSNDRMTDQRIFNGIVAFVFVGAVVLAKFVG